MREKRARGASCNGPRGRLLCSLSAVLTVAVELSFCLTLKIIGGREMSPASDLEPDRKNPGSLSLSLCPFSLFLLSCSRPRSPHSATYIPLLDDLSTSGQNSSSTERSSGERFSLLSSTPPPPPLSIRYYVLSARSLRVQLNLKC